MPILSNFIPEHGNNQNQFLPQLEDIFTAATRIQAYIHKTPIQKNSSIASIIGASEFYAKCENFQKVEAFKARGAWNALFSLSDEEAKNGVVAHSSGNHAQGVAYAARMRKVPVLLLCLSQVRK